jgi:dienelactone hydrolase
MKNLYAFVIVIISGLSSAVGNESDTDLMLKMIAEQNLEEVTNEGKSSVDESGLDMSNPSAGVKRAPMHERLNPDVRRTWDRAVVYLPNKRFTTTPDKVELSSPHTVVLYLHGCEGITSFNDRPWARYLADQGYVVIMLDSFARKGRPSNCDGSTRKVGFFPLAHFLRYEEIVWGLHKLSTVPWADSNNIFLMGHSEGGRAVSDYMDGGARGIIVSGYHCARANWKQGTPALAINYETDPWYPNTNMRCAENWTGKPIKDVTLPGNEHETYFRAEAREAVRDFIKENETQRQ